MNKDESPNGLVVKTAPRAGYLGGGVSRKLLGIIAVCLFALVMFIFYVISQKGQHGGNEADDPTTVEQKGGGDNMGLNDVLGAAPKSGVIKQDKPVTPTTALPSGPLAQEKAQAAADRANEETESERRARIAHEQQLEQIRQQKAQQFQTALSAKSDINFDMKDEKDKNDGGSTEQRQNAPGITAADLGLSANEDQNKQDVKMAFTKEAHSNTYLMQGREKPLSQYELKVGTLIPATMISGLNSDLPGQIIASVSQSVYDSATGSHLLIPQGSKLYGTYDSQVAYGQDRALVAWTRINYPDGTTLELKGMGAIDAGGYAGFEDQVDHHYWKIFGNAALLGLITGATEAGVSDGNSDDTSTAESVNNGVAEQFAETGSTLIEKNLDVQPTITIRNGYKFNIMLNKDAVLEPYQPVD